MSKPLYAGFEKVVTRDGEKMAVFRVAEPLETSWTSANGIRTTGTLSQVQLTAAQIDSMLAQENLIRLTGSALKLPN